MRARQWLDHGASAVVWVMAGIVIGVFVWILGDVAVQGLSGLDLAFVTEAPEDAGRAGGIWPILASTMLILAVCIATAAPIGLATGILLAEFSNRLPRFVGIVRMSLDTLAGVPSIVFGLFGNAVFTSIFGFGFSILAGGLTLACMVLPILIRAIEESLRAVSDDIRRASAALALSVGTLIGRVLLPTALPGLVAGLVLGIGRAAAETAALVFTSGYVDRMPDSLLDSGRALSVHIFDLALNVPGGTANAYKSALVLIGLLLVINLLILILARTLSRSLRGYAT